MPAAGAEALLHRILWGGLAAGAVALVARRYRQLTTDGAVSATAVGTICAAAGWTWAAALIAFFVTGSLWSRVGSVTKAALTAAIVAKGGERDAMQVVANGGVFALCALACVLSGGVGATPGRPELAGLWAAGSTWRAAAGGALAAAASDTWATEIGTMWGGRPRSISSGRPVAPGASGGITAIGTLGGMAGAAALGCLLGALGWGWDLAAAATAGGVGGMLVDSLVGATVQQRRWCERCKVPTERDVHTCGATTRASGGLSWLDNDGVNALATLAGVCIALTLYRSLS